VEVVDAMDSKSISRDTVSVQVRSEAPKNIWRFGSMGSNLFSFQ